MEKKNMSTVEGPGAWYCETSCIKNPSGESVFIRS